MRRDPPERGKWLAPTLVAAMTETLDKKQQALLFLNRRGYAPLTLCRSCGHRFDCPQCTAWLVEHRYRHRLNCHHCGFSLPLPEKCPKCGDVDSLVACGPGVERIAEEVAERFPEARLALLSSDLVPSLIEMREIIKTIEAGEADIIIGTQMVAKGHHFPQLATVGVVDGDLGLGTADPRAAERTFQLLHQVTGRAGRVLTAGRGFVQTYMPEHPVMQAIITGDRDAFLDSEIRQRQAGLLPPYGRLAALIVSARDKELAELFARDVARHAPAGRAHRGAGPGRGAARRDPRPPSLAPAGQGAARARPAGLSARLARHPAQAALRPAADGGHRSLQFSLTLRPRPERMDLIPDQVHGARAGPLQEMGRVQLARVKIPESLASAQEPGSASGNAEENRPISLSGCRADPPLTRAGRCYVPYPTRRSGNSGRTARAHRRRRSSRELRNDRLRRDQAADHSEPDAEADVAATAVVTIPAVMAAPDFHDAATIGCLDRQRCRRTSCNRGRRRGRGDSRQREGARHQSLPYCHSSSPCSVSPAELMHANTV